MGKYIGWVFMQFFLLLFQPSKLRQINGIASHNHRTWNNHLTYLFKMLPILIILIILGTFISLIFCLKYDYDYWWPASEISLVLGVTLFCIFWANKNIVFGTIFGFVFGIGNSIALGLMPIIAPNIPEAVLIISPSLIYITLALLIIVIIGIISDYIIVTSFCTSFTLVVGCVLSLCNQSTVVINIIFGNYTLGITCGVMVGVFVGIAFGIASGIAYYIEGNAVFGVFTGLVAGSITSIIISISDGLYSVTICVSLFVSFIVMFYLIYYRIFNYPIDAVISIFVYLAAKSNTKAALQLWKRSPILWNELIYLPLPGAGKLLTLATRLNREMGFQNIVFVATERPLQRSVAINAFKEVVLGDLESNDIQQLALLSNRMAWATTTSTTILPVEFTNMWPLFQSVSLHTSQFLSVFSTYRKSVAIEEAINSVKILQKSLLVASREFDIQLLEVVNNWYNILEIELSQINQLTSEHQATRNPFISGNPLDIGNSNVFVGRKDIVRQIEESILGSQQSPTLLLHGPRRMGKTSILKQLPNMLGAEFVTAMLDCENPKVAGSEASVQSFLKFLSVSLSSGLQLRHINVSQLTSEELERTPYAVFDEWLERVENAMPLTMRALLCLDEYEKLQNALNAGWGEEFLDFLRHILQHRPKFILLFTGVHTFSEMGSAWTDRFISTRRLRVSFLNFNDVTTLLKQPIPDFDLIYAPGALEKLIAVTNGQPFIVQAIAFEMVQYLNEQNRKESTPIDVEIAINRTLDRGGEYFAGVWKDVGEHGQIVLKAIANGQQHPIPPAIYKRLREHDVLNNDGKFAIPLMELWVKENVVEDEHIVQNITTINIVKTL